MKPRGDEGFRADVAALHRVKARVDTDERCARDTLVAISRHLGEAIRLLGELDTGRILARRDGPEEGPDGGGEPAGARP